MKFFIIYDFLFLKQNIPICANNNRFIYGSLAIISEIIFQLLSNATFGLCVWWTLSEVIKNANLLETCKISKFSWAQARQLWKMIRLTFGRLRSRYESTNWSAKHFANTSIMWMSCVQKQIYPWKSDLCSGNSRSSSPIWIFCLLCGIWIQM